MFSCSVCNWCYYIVTFLLLIAIFIKLVCKLTAGISTSDTCLVGKTVLVTGGNSGIGYQTALTLAGRGARVLIADKNEATESVRKIIEETGNKNVSYINLDLASLASVRHFAKKINAEETQLDILINNAGIGALCDYLTDDGLQITMQVNHFGPFLLTHLLAGE
ncbi:phosphatidylinositol-glycan biosynthesis class f protein-related [Holotrichia oblita]|uniref:Phosphatidylinositol-glycan biosynthesis class f protein-related n=1 Tax=Holotrichia oblita TaxID=644536 RepID=A0ACB9SVE8_HOLOL|nr:phosphatidylinositol-glycan biosynthesis class f protein-related [Holotrichia oblita]